LTSHQLVRLCHTQTQPQVYLSTGNSIVVQFVSDISNAGRGFNATYHTVDGGKSLNHRRWDQSPRILSGHTTANCAPYFVMFHDFYHQNMPFQAKKIIFHFFPERGLAPSADPFQWEVNRNPLPTPTRRSQPRLLDPLLRPPEFQSCLCIWTSVVSPNLLSWTYLAYQKGSPLPSEGDMAP